VDATYRRPERKKGEGGEQLKIKEPKKD